MNKRSIRPCGWMLLWFAYSLADQDRVQRDVEGGEHQGDRAEQLDQNVQRGTSGILERIAHGIAHNAGLVRLTLLAQNNAGLVVGTDHFALSVDAHAASFDLLP